MKAKWNGLEVSGRAHNCLLRSGIRTPEQLSEKTPKELLRIRNLGETTLVELRMLLMTQGLRLKGDTGTDGEEETAYLNSIPGMAESILEGISVPIEDCVPEEAVEW